jgi:hypothetical protein
MGYQRIKYVSYTPILVWIVTMALAMSQKKKKIKPLRPGRFSYIQNQEREDNLWKTGKTD